MLKGVKLCKQRLLSLEQICKNLEANKSGECEYINIVSFVVTLNCYGKPLFLALTGLFIVIGTILNLLSLYIFLKSIKRNPQYVYLSALSLFDTINLYLNFALPMLRQWDAFDTRFRSMEWLCRSMGVFTEFFLIFSTWIVVLLTVERLTTISLPPERRTLFTQYRAKISIVILAVLVFILSLYRCVDLQGIDQISVFSVLACNGKGRPIGWIRNMNLMIWTIVPECLTFVMSLIIVSQIRSMTSRFQPDGSEIHRSKYNRATRTVLLIAILFLVSHTPTGITIALDLFSTLPKSLLKISLILSSRKLTILLYEISLSCKFFVYNRTFPHFTVLPKFNFRLTRQQNSARLGRRGSGERSKSYNHWRSHFSAQKPSVTTPTSQTESYTKQEGEHHPTVPKRHGQSHSTNSSWLIRDEQALNPLLNKVHTKGGVLLSRRIALRTKYSIESQ